jgi:APA family basic amino acid/polyamine antiporter
LAGTSTTAASSGRLLRILGLGFALAVIIGSTIGVGILRTPGTVAGHLHGRSTILVVWLAGGLYTLLGSVCLAELGTMTPREGGYYVYARRAFGDWVGFAVGWTDWLTYCVVLGYVSIGMSEFIAVLVPSLAGSINLVGVALLVGFVALQWAGVRVSSRFQEWATALKCVAFLAVIGAALVMSRGGGSGASAAAAPAAGLTLVGLVAALQSVVIAYGGWQSGLYFAEEDRDPARNLPRAMIGGVVSVVIIYLLVNVALLAVVPVSQMAGSKLPAADAAQALVGARGGQLITVLSLISLPPLLNAILMIGTRVLFAMGRDRLFWSRTAGVNAGGTPGAATLVTTAVAIPLIATGTFERLVAIAALFLAANYTVCCLALFALRRREPGAARPFRAWGYPWSAAIVLAGALAFLAGVLVADPRSAVSGAALLAVGLAGRAVSRRLAARSDRGA